ncbi:MAG: hypothetical protein ABUL62_01380 [Myxococcales bacterium]
MGGANAVAGGAGADDVGDAGASDAGAAGDPAMGPIATDFPKAPILEVGVPPNAPEIFDAATDTLTSPLCVLEPQLSAGDVPGAMFPSNWLRPRFRFSAVDVDLFQIRLHSAAESNDLVVYTTAKTWYLPKEIWAGQGAKAGLGAAAAGGQITVTVRALDSSAPLASASVSGTFNIAPASTSGSILFPTLNSWAATPDSYRVFGFAVGEEGVQVALTLPQIAWSGELGEDGAVLRGFYDNPKIAGFVDGQVRVITRPALTPDGQALVFSDDYPYSIVASQLTVGPVGSVPSYLGTGAAGMLRMPWLGSQSLSPGHWANQDRVLISSYGTTFKSGKARTLPWDKLPVYAGTDGATASDYIKWHALAWFDLEAGFAVDLSGSYGSPALQQRNNAVAAARGKSWNLIATGDTNMSDVSPSFNSAGDSIAYVATDYSPFGEPYSSAKVADVRVVPYHDRAGGVSRAVQGASDPNYLEYEPTFSPDGKLIAFSRAPTGGPDGPFRNRFGEVTVVATTGGTPAPLVANTPNVCAGDSLPLTLLNGSPTWGPTVGHWGGRSYYFLLFTSVRKYGDEFSTPFQIGGTDNTGTLRNSTQLYLTTVVVNDKTGSVASYPAIYLWNQNRIAGPDGAGVGTQYANMTPVWGSTELAPLGIEAAK